MLLAYFAVEARIRPLMEGSRPAERLLVRYAHDLAASRPPSIVGLTDDERLRVRLYELSLLAGAPDPSTIRCRGRGPLAAHAGRNFGARLSVAEDGARHLASSAAARHLELARRPAARVLLALSGLHVPAPAGALRRSRADVFRLVARLRGEGPRRPPHDARAVRRGEARRARALAPDGETSGHPGHTVVRHQPDAAAARVLDHARCLDRSRAEPCSARDRRRNTSADRPRSV